MIVQPEVVKQLLVDAVLEYYRDPLKFELRCIFDQTYANCPDQYMRGGDLE